MELGSTENLKLSVLGGRMGLCSGFILFTLSLCFCLTDFKSNVVSLTVLEIIFNRLFIVVVSFQRDHWLIAVITYETRSFLLHWRKCYLSYRFPLFLFFLKCYILSVIFSVTSLALPYSLQVLNNAGWFSGPLEHLLSLGNLLTWSKSILDYTFDMLEVLSSTPCDIHISDI